ncbi:hypothetical protein FKN01_27730 [Streptomyces sp. 130]|nr:hypothetical protein FKN01_27730 [Streptomyces sp. 130]
MEAVPGHERGLAATGGSTSTGEALCHLTLKGEEAAATELQRSLSEMGEPESAASGFGRGCRPGGCGVRAAAVRPRSRAWQRRSTAASAGPMPPADRERGVAGRCRGGASLRLARLGTWCRRARERGAGKIS